MKVSRNLTATVIIAATVLGTLYYVGGNPLRVTNLTAAESDEPYDVINRGEDSAPEDTSDTSDSAEAAPAPESDAPYSADGGADASQSTADSHGPQDTDDSQVAAQPEPEPDSEPSNDGAVAHGGDPVPQFIGKLPFGVTGPEQKPADVKKAGSKHDKSPAVASDVPHPASIASTDQAKPSAAKNVIAKAPASKAEPQVSTITCFAGCGDKNQKPVYQGEMNHIGVGPEVKPAGNANQPESAEAPTIDCVAGCYDNRKSYPAGKAPAGAPPMIPSPAANSDRRT